ncbi:MAG TPA: hypothetical protein VI365_30335 [Trebonia sp.]
MLPPRPIRRLVLVPLVTVIAAGLVALTPLVALLSATLKLVRRRTRPGDASRSRALRVACLALAWSAGEIAALTVLLCLWIASGLGGRLGTESYQARHYMVMRSFLNLIYRVAQRACGLRVRVAGPAGAPGPGDRPVIVLSRHAGPGDSLLLIHHLLSACGRRPRVVMKATLQLDPITDVVANRVPNAFLRHPARTGTSGTAGQRSTAGLSGTAGQSSSAGFTGTVGFSGTVGQIRRLAAGLDPSGALVIFPEGGNWTPRRWRRAIDRLRQQGHEELAGRAAAMPNVLPPRPAGTLAALAACPDADVIFVAHTGLDRLAGVRDVWRSLLADMEVRARWWQVPSANVPRGDREAQVAWLYDWWERIDGWITAQNAGHLPVPSALGEE